MPGRKTDVTDAAWLCQLAEAGLFRASFVPPKPIRALRNLTRYRKTQIQERAREANRLHKALEDTGIKLDCVASDILGSLGRAMLAALIEGTTDPEILSELARVGCAPRSPRSKKRSRAASTGSTRLDRRDPRAPRLPREQIDQLTDAIEEQIAPFAKPLTALHDPRRPTAHSRSDHRRDRHRHERVPDRRTPRVMGRAVPRQRPIRRQTPLREDPKGSKWLDWALEEAAIAAIRTKDIYLAAQYHRLRPRRGHKKALGAVKHSILIACWHMLSTGELYRDLGGDYYRKRDPERLTKRLIAQLESLGHKVVLEELPQAA